MNMNVNDAYFMTSKCTVHELDKTVMSLYSMFMDSDRAYIKDIRPLPRTNPS